MKIKAVIIDLSNNEVRELDYDSEKWLGGRGLATRILMDHCDPACDPLGPDNAIVFAASPLTGTIAPTAGRGHAVFKSPLTGAIGSCNSGGHWGKVMKSSGVDAIVIKGAAKSPVHITITDQGAELGDRIKIKDAQDLWGKDVHETTSILTERLGKTASILAIGPAGENKVRFAALMNDKNRAYGRGGPGAVFGTKNLKAIAVSGSRKTEVADLKRLKKAVEQSRHIMKAVPATKRVLRDLGTAGLIRLINMMGILPRKNFRDCTHVEALLDQISGETLSEKILVKPGACFGCPIMCARHTRIGDKTGEGPEYETIVLMGTVMDIYDLEAITLANYASNELGMDTISLGGALACAAELFDLKEIGLSDFSGPPVRFGDADIYPEIVYRIAKRDGIGGLIADGALRMANRIGRPETAMTVKGLEIPGYDPRGMPAQALGYMTSPTGACHLKGGYSIGLGFFGGIK